MHKVLIWKKITPGSEYDIFHQVDSTVQTSLMVQNGTFNVGNRLWFQGIVSAIDTKENAYHYLTDSMSCESINENFDFIILPMANIFNVKFSHYLKDLSDKFSKIHIPVYVIACGAQAENCCSVDSLIEGIGDLSRRFISSIYETGGEFALRGEFTKLFFDKLGFPSAVVTGCPSMYQLGRDFQLHSKDTDFSSINPGFNGNIHALDNLLAQYTNSNFMDQDAFLSLLCQEKGRRPTMRDAFIFFCNFDPLTAKLLGDDRIRLIPDMKSWRNYLMQSHMNYMFGSRIHGTIMAILSGIPATIITVDSRTEEMAEFFEIPRISYEKGHNFTLSEFQKAYEACDFTLFNQKFKQNYDRYEAFLTSHGIVSHLKQGNRFFHASRADDSLLSCSDTAYYQSIGNLICKYHRMFRLMRKIRLGV